MNHTAPDALASFIRRLFVISLCLPLFFAPSCASDQPITAIREPAKPPISADLPAAPLPVSGKALPGLESLDALMQDFMQKSQAPGASLAITYKGRLVYAKGFGYADLANKQPVQPANLFRIASISKPITALAILRLVEEGKISLKDKVFDIIKFKPEELQGVTVDPRLASITLEHLLEHRGGWDRDKSFDAMFKAVEFAKALNVPPPASARDVIRHMMGVKLDFDPGDRYAYSNYGYNLLGRVIEVVTGEDYGQYVTRTILAPSGAMHTRLGKTLPPGRAPGEVVYHDPEHYGKAKSVFADNLGKPVPWSYGGWHLEAMDSHGAWISSTTDLLRILNQLEASAKPGLLKPPTLARMLARPVGLKEPNKLPLDERTAERFYALGWGVRIMKSGGHNFGHTGLLSGTSTELTRRHDGVNFSVLFNGRETLDRKVLTSEFSPRIQAALYAIKAWPEGDLFPEFP